jgi:phage shock protein PspC (stress-responsive transcriptional regulator)
MVTGVAGGLGEYFRVDPVIFRVLFAVLSFFGGVGLIVYLACWLLMPEPDVQISALDRGIAQLRVRRIPAWLVIGGAAFVLWVGWFSWWAPGPTFPALVVMAVLLIVLIRRMSTPPMPSGWVPGPPPHAPYPWETRQPPAPASEPVTGPTSADDQPAESPPTDPDDPTTTAWYPTGPFGGTGAYGGSDAGLYDGLGMAGFQTERLAPPLDDPRVAMRDWYSEARETRLRRRARRRPIAIAIASVLVVGLTILGIVDEVQRIDFSVYLWFAFGVLTLGFAVSLLARRPVWLAAPFAVVLIPALIVFGGTPASITDGSGRNGWVPTSPSQLTTQRQFAGKNTIDLTQLTLTEPQTVKITQAAGLVQLRVPATANIVIHARVHLGDIQIGNSRATGYYVAGVNSELTAPAPNQAPGPLLTVDVELTVGHIQIDRVS